MLTACALPGASGMGSFTQEFCASRGLTLDATSKQCVTPPALQRAETTGSLPSQTVTTEQPSSPPAQPQEKRAGLSVPIEQDAVIRPDSSQNSETAAEFAHFVRASGYRCDSISALVPRPGGFTLACNRSTFRYAIKGKDGRWIVTIE
jgi:hypothetical protein